MFWFGKQNIYIVLILLILEIIIRILILLILIIKMEIKFVGKSKLTKQGQLTLPFEARQDLSIKKDNELYWYLVDHHLVVVKELVNPKELREILKEK